MRRPHAARLLIALAAFLLLPAAALGLTVKSSATVEGPVVRLGDVLVDAGAAADRVVAAAPEPGESTNLSYYEIAKVARDAGLTPADIGRGYIEIRRAGRVVPEELLQERLRTAFAARGIDGPLGVRLTGLNDPLYVPLGADPEGVEVESLRHDARSRRFEVTFRVPAERSGKVRRVSVAGVLEIRRRIPVLAKPMEPGETIGEDDLAWITLDEQRINRTMLVSAEAMIGKEPARPLRAETPLRRTDLRRPVLVEKGALVTMVARKGPMTLTAIGKAMQDGARGELVRLVNTDSNRTVEARVTGPDRVEVITAAGLLAAGR